MFHPLLEVSRKRGGSASFIGSCGKVGGKGYLKLVEPDLFDAGFFQSILRYFLSPGEQIVFALNKADTVIIFYRIMYYHSHTQSEYSD